MQLFIVYVIEKQISHLIKTNKTYQFYDLF